MPPKSSNKLGCFTRLFRWGLGGLGLLVACGVAANLLPFTDAPAQPTITPNLLVESQPAPTDAATAAVSDRQPISFSEVLKPEPSTAEAPTAIPPTATTAPVVEVQQVAPQQSPIDAPTATSLPPTDTPQPPTATPIPPPIANRDANLRGGPGTAYPVVGGVTPGQMINAVAASPDGDWLLLDNGAWIAVFLVDNLHGVLPVAQNIPAAPAPPTNTPLPVVIEVPPTAPPPPPATPVPVQVQQPAQQNCDPSYPDFCLEPGIPDLNCADIPWRRFRVYQPDPHGFDGNDNDGLGCESG